MTPEGQSAVVVLVPAVEPVVSTWRSRFDPSAARGMPAHITLLYPFLPERCLTETVNSHLGALCRELDPLEVTFVRTARFPGVLYLDPEPADHLRNLTVAIAERWPDTPPYDGQHDDIVPHLTVAHADEATLDPIEADVTSKLPLTALLGAARLYVFDGERWQAQTQFGFHGSCTE